ncbi:MAG: hypothetical protein QM532_04305 [Cyanobium sp. MAG06]|nr:hypothetical protein [Cyanobium sp. MAG06]
MIVAILVDVVVLTQTGPCCTCSAGHSDIADTIIVNPIDTNINNAEIDKTILFKLFFNKCIVFVKYFI